MEARKRGRREVTGNDLKYRLTGAARHKPRSGGTFAMGTSGLTCHNCCLLV